MPRKTEPSASAEKGSKKRSTSATRGTRMVRTLARTTLFAAGIAATRIGSPEIEPGFQMFDPTLVDRLQAPITRYHE